MNKSKLHDHISGLCWEINLLPSSERQKRALQMAGALRGMIDAEAAASGQQAEPNPFQTQLGLADKLKQLSDTATFPSVSSTVLAKTASELALLVATLKDANDMCRSAAEIARRAGKETNWEAFGARLHESLHRQHMVMYPNHPEAK